MDPGSSAMTSSDMGCGGGVPATSTSDMWLPTTGKQKLISVFINRLKAKSTKLRLLLIVRYDAKVGLIYLSNTISDKSNTKMN